MAMQVTLAQAKPLVLDTFRANLAPNLVSSPGIGKSALAAQIAEEYNLKLIDVRLTYFDPSDLNGFPYIYQNTLNTAGVKKAGYVPMDTFPIEGDPLPVKTWKKNDDGSFTLDKAGNKIPETHYAGWLLLLDEFPSAVQSVQAAAYKVVLDKVVGNWPLHKKVAIMTAGNRMTDKAIVNRLSTAMQSRIITLDIKVCIKAWMIWADTHNIDYRVKSFLNFRNALLHKFDPNHSDYTFPCPRTWEFTSKIISHIPTIGGEKLPLLAGTVGEGAAQEFFAYTKVFGQIPTIEDILADPEFVPMGDEKSIHYALSGLVGKHMDEHNAEKLIKFLHRLDIDFQVITLKSATARNKAIRDCEGYRKWIAKNAAELM